MQKRCYIAGKITGLTEAEYMAEFDKAKVEVAQLGFTPVNPVELSHDHGKTWKEYMKEDLTELLKCDSLYALQNWQQSAGARFEVNTAVNAGINVIYQ